MTCADTSAMLIVPELDPSPSSSAGNSVRFRCWTCVCAITCVWGNTGVKIRGTCIYGITHYLCLDKIHLLQWTVTCFERSSNNVTMQLSIIHVCGSIDFLIDRFQASEGLSTIHGFQDWHAQLCALSIDLVRLQTCCCLPVQRPLRRSHDDVFGQRPNYVRKITHCILQRVTCALTTHKGAILLRARRHLWLWGLT